MVKRKIKLSELIAVLRNKEEEYGDLEVGYIGKLVNNKYAFRLYKKENEVVIEVDEYVKIEE